MTNCKDNTPQLQNDEQIRQTEFDDIWVTSQGRVFRRVGEDTPSWVEKTLRLDGGGYHRCTVWTKSGRKDPYVHRLMAQAFELPKADGADIVLHNDDNKTNNILSNLKWGTHKENAADARRNRTGRGVPPKPNQKLNDVSVSLLRTHAAEQSLSDWSRIFNVSISTISNALYGVTWKHVETQPWEPTTYRRARTHQRAQHAETKALQANVAARPEDQITITLHTQKDQ